MAETFLGFYTSRPFWAGDAHSVQKRLMDLESLRDEARAGEALTELMIQEALTYETAQYVFKVCKDGMFLLHIKQLAQPPSKGRDAYERPLSYLDYLNCLYLLFQSAVLKNLEAPYFEVSEITDKDVFLVKFEDGRLLGCFAPRLSFAHQLRMAQLHPAHFYRDAQSDQRLALSEAVFVTLNADLAKIAQDYRSLRILSEITKSLCDCKFGHYANSLVSLWQIIESYLASTWSQFIDSQNTMYEDGSKRIKSERMKHLKDGRVYSASVISNVLELFGLIDLETFKKIEKVRDQRNQIVHRDEKTPCKLEHCQVALDLVKGFVAQETGIDLNFDLTYLILEPLGSSAPA